MKQFTKKLAIAGVCLCVTASTLTGCSGKVEADSVVATVDGDEIPYGLVNFMVRYTQAQYEQFYAMYGEYLGVDSSTSIWEQSSDGVTTLGDNIKENIVSTLAQMYLLEDHMEEYDVAITEEEREAMETAADEFLAANTQETLDEMTADKDTVVRMLELNTISTKMQQALYDTADTEVSDEEAAQRGVTTAFFSTATDADATAADATASEASDTDATVSDAQEEAREKAQQVLDEVKDGKDIDEVLAEIDSSVTSTYTTYGTDDEETTLDAQVKEAADALTEDGQVAEELVETDSGYYVVQLTTTLDRDATDVRKEEIISERQSEAYSTALEGWQEEAEISVSERVLNNIDFKDTMTIISTQEEETTPADATAGQATEAEASEDSAVQESETEDVYKRQGRLKI